MVAKMQKDFGKLTTDQFCAFIGKLPEVRRQRDELGRLLADLPEEKFDTFGGNGFNMSPVYECSFAEHIAIVVVAFGRAKWLLDLANAPDPQRAVFEQWAIEGDEVVPHSSFQPQSLIGLAFTLQRTILSVMLFQRSMSGLIQEVRENDDMDALFNAVRVDRSVVSCPTIAYRIARAQMRNDKRFFLRLRNALKGPTQKHWASYCDLRYSLYTLRELGFDKLTDTQLENLLVHHLKVYPNTPSARKNLRAQYQQSKKINTI